MHETFNGAATSRPRKVVDWTDVGDLGGTFNGAATSRPRKAHVRAQRSAAAQKPSMEPRPLGRGRGALRVRSCLKCILQWSRDLSAAEGPRRRAPRFPAAAFNGAATSRPRKDGSAEGRRRQAAPSMEPRPLGRGRPDRTRRENRKQGLQWSRDLSAAEGQAGKPVDAAGRVPSMEPRPLGRGRRIIPRSAT